MVSARKLVADAQVEVTKIQTQMRRIEAKVETTFTDKPDWAAARADLKTSQAEYDSAVKALLAKVHETPEYKALAQKKKEAGAKLDAAAKPDDQTSKEELNAAADERAKSALGMVKMDSQALADDPKVANAKEKLAQARKAMEALRAQVMDAAQQDPEWVANKQLLDQAQQKLQQAKDQLSQIEHPKAAAAR